MEHFSVVLFPTHSRTNNRVVVLTVDMQRHVFCLNIPFLLPISTVNLVELYDAAWSVCSGAAPDAAETEAAARPTATWTRHTESPREDTLVWNMIQQKRWNTTSSNRKFPALPARGGWRTANDVKRQAQNEPLTWPTRDVQPSPLLYLLSHSLCLSLSLWGRASTYLSRCSARSRADSEGDTLSLIASSLPLGVQGHSPVSSGLKTLD